MVIIYMVATIVGGAATAALFGQHGLLTALVAAPFGGSLMATATALFLVQRSPSSARSRDVPQGVVWC